MECKNLLITKSNLIEHCDLSENADDNRVNVAITQAQNQLRALLCREYFDWLIDNNNPGPLTGKHLILLDTYIEPYLSWKAFEKYTLIGSQENTKSGFREQTSENSQPVTEARLNAIRKNAEEQVQYYQGEMMYYINSNIDSLELDGSYTFVLYRDSDCYDCRQTKQSFKITGAGGKKKEYSIRYIKVT